MLARAKADIAGDIARRESERLADREEPSRSALVALGFDALAGRSEGLGRPGPRHAAFAQRGRFRPSGRAPAFALLLEALHFRRPGL